VRLGATDNWSGRRGARDGIPAKRPPLGAWSLAGDALDQSAGRRTDSAVTDGRASASHPRPGPDIRPHTIHNELRARRGPRRGPSSRHFVAVVGMSPARSPLRTIRSAWQAVAHPGDRYPRLPPFQLVSTPVPTLPNNAANAAVVAWRCPARNGSLHVRPGAAAGELRIPRINPSRRCATQRIGGRTARPLPSVRSPTRT
jgi:hypothetical protein